MKRIFLAGRPLWTALGVAAVLACAGSWLPSRTADYGPIGAGASHAADEPATAAQVPRAGRRVRASSSMPYFSFARALRAGG